MSEKMSGAKKASATSKKKEVKTFFGLVMPTNYLPQGWKFMLGLTGMLTLCTATFMVIRPNTVETQRLTYVRINKNKEFNDDDGLPEKGTCYYYSKGWSDKRILKWDEGWTSLNEGQDRVYLTVGNYRPVLHLSYDLWRNGWKPQWSFELPGFKKTQDSHSWDIGEEGHLVCRLPEYTLKHVLKNSVLHKTVLLKDGPICAWYGNNGRIIWLAKETNWRSSEQFELTWQKDVGAFLDIYMAEKLLRGYYLQLPDTWSDVPEVLTWILPDFSYLECKPGDQIMKLI